MDCLKAAFASAAIAFLCHAAVAGSPEAPPAFSAADKADLARVETYFDSIRTVSGHFLQSADGDVYAQGSFYIERPGKMRIQYDPPTPYFLVASGSTLSIYDAKLKKASYVPVDATPAYYLFKDRVGFGDAIAVTKIERGEASLRVTVHEKEHPGDGHIVLIFSDRPLELKKWAMFDSKGQETDIALVNVQFNNEIDPNLFKFVDPTPTGSGIKSMH